MNAVEIEEAVSRLIEQEFDASEFPNAFLESFGNKPATIKRLRSTGKNTTNKSDLGSDDGLVAVLQRNNIYIATCENGGPDAVAELLQRLTDSPATQKHKAKFALATDGETVHAASLNTDDAPLVCKFEELADHFGYFLELAGISTVRQIRENAFDIKATGRLNRLYVELLRHNPDWDGDERRQDLNHFFARLIFCFFAEDTGIFHGSDLFTDTVRQMSEPGGGNTHMILAEIFRAMDVSAKDRHGAELRSWANQFPYVNGGLFGGGTTIDDVPKFTQIARSYLLHIGSLDWTQINPDIFGSMIQAVADDEERGALGMHYTSVPNILKVLNPLFLNDLREKLEEAGDNGRKLLNLRKRLARIRVFDPACGSGNFLVIAYKEMRKIEAEINRRRDEADRPTDIPLTNFRGIEIRHFAAEVARLALVIAEYQCDELHRGQRLALAEFLPLENNNWITHGNALRLDWLKVCPLTQTTVRLVEDDLFQTPLEQPEIDFEGEGGEAYICGNPPYRGSTYQTKTQKEEIRTIAGERCRAPGMLDYISGWFLLAARCVAAGGYEAAFVSTNSICQGQAVPLLWPIIFGDSIEIAFAYSSFQWSNLASHNAGVIVAIIGLRPASSGKKYLWVSTTDGETVRIESDTISPYLTPGAAVIVEKRKTPLSDLPAMEFGNKPSDGGNLLLSYSELRDLRSATQRADYFTRRIYGSSDYIKDAVRYCLWIQDEDLGEASAIAEIKQRIEATREVRSASPDSGANTLAKRAHQLKLMRIGKRQSIVAARTSSISRSYLPCGLIDAQKTVTSETFAIYDGDLRNLGILCSRMHLVWVATVCGKLKTDYRYSNTLGWNTFPVPTLTDKNKADLNRCAEDILLAREAHWPATIAELYDTEKMPDDLRAAHDRNDDTLERIYIGRRFRNDTERLETLFRMYTEMTEKDK